jgi:cytochrome c oxidase subunit 2
MPLFRGAKRWLIMITGLLMSSILLVACGENSPSILNPAGPVASSESGVFYVILIIATIIFVGVEGILIFSIFKYRERPGMPTPPQMHGSMKVEIIWTVLPAIILFVVLGYTIKGLFEVATPPANERSMEVVAYGHQWWWEFYYPEYNITTADSLVVPANTVIHVKLYSDNVIHSFWVPALTGKVDVVPGHDNERWFKADQANKTYLGICAEYCGTQHANMRFDVVTNTPDNFMTWAHTQQQSAVVPARGSLEEKGQQLFQQQCTACHGIVGVNVKQEQRASDPRKNCDALTAGVAQGCWTGPNLTHFGSRKLIAGGVLENNADQCQPGSDLKNCNLAKWLRDPQQVKPGNAMNVGQLTEEQITQLVAYLESLK